MTSVRSLSSAHPQTNVTKYEADRITYWYRLNPSSSGSPGGTTGNNPAMGQEEIVPGQVSQDRVFLSVLVTASSIVSVQIGDHNPTTLHAHMAGLHHFSVPFRGQIGPVHITISRSRSEIVSTVGPEITDQCVDGAVNWNAIVGSSDSLPSNH